MEVPREMAATLSTPVFETQRSKTVGMMTEAMARTRRDAAVWATVVLKNCSSRRRPPQRKHIPRTRRRLERMEPMREVLTMTISSLVRAITETITSTALPNVALSRPPRVSPTRRAISSVA